ncbi:MAG: XdhC family protein [Gammaproteobacteria bacterium]|nr:XdhC family protein [Gammaproteobacteria bacterium]
MQSVDQQVLGQARDWLRAGQTCWLATVVATYGSSPRPVGSLLTCNPAGHIEGSLSGGCVEDDLLKKLTAGELAQGRPQFCRYGETEEEAEQLGLPCGGHLDIVVEPHSPTPSTQAHFDRLVGRLANRACVERRILLKSGTFDCRDVADHAELRYDHDNGVLVQTYGPQDRLFVIGTNMVSAYVAEIAIALGYDVLVCDPRPERLASFNVAGARKVGDMPDDAVRRYASDSHSAIVALTHDPRIDDMGLMEALKTDAFYVGAMGSARTSSNRRERLTQLDLKDTEIRRLHAPIGLPIGSKTPPEIAIAVLAEITAVRKQCAADARAAIESIAAGG